MRILNSRRTVIAILAIASLFALGLVTGSDVAAHIAAIAIAFAGSNAAQAVFKKSE